MEQQSEKKGRGQHVKHRNGTPKGWKKKESTVWRLKPELQASLELRFLDALSDFPSMAEAARFLNLHVNTIKLALKTGGIATETIANRFQLRYRKKLTPFSAGYLRPDLGNRPGCNGLVDSKKKNLNFYVRVKQEAKTKRAPKDKNKNEN